MANDRNLESKPGSSELTRVSQIASLRSATMDFIERSLIGVQAGVVMGGFTTILLYNLNPEVAIGGGLLMGATAARQAMDLYDEIKSIDLANVNSRLFFS